MRALILGLLLLFSRGICSGFVYVVADATDINVIDTSTNTVVATISGLLPFNGLAGTPDGAFVYVPSTSKNVYVISTQTQTVVATIPVPFPASPADVSIVTLPGGVFAYVVDNGAGLVSVIDTATNLIVATISVPGTSLDFIATSASAGLACVSDTLNGNSIFINLSTNMVVSTLFTDVFTQGVVFNPSGSLVYVSDFNNNAVLAVDPTIPAIVTTIPVATPLGLAISPDGSILYCAAIANYIGIETMTNMIVATIPSPGFAVEVAFSLDGSTLYGSNQIADSVSVIDVASKTTVDIVPGIFIPQALTFVPLFVPPVNIPYTLKGEQIGNRFLTQTDLVNIITWSAPPNFTPVFYQIFRDAALTDLAGTVSASEELQFEDHNRRRKQLYTYFVIAVDQSGNTANLGGVTVFPIN